MDKETVEYHPKMQIIVDMVHCLYNLPGCGCGGCCHIVTDDENIEDEDLKFVIDYCKRSDNSNCIDKELSSLICELLLQLSYEQRIILFYMFNHDWLEDGIDNSIWNSFFSYHLSCEEIVNEWKEKER